jgi:hypothetical protein
MIVVTPVLCWIQRMLGLPPTVAECLPRFGAPGLNFLFDLNNCYSCKTFLWVTTSL